MSLSRRSFLKFAGITGIAVAAPALIMPPVRTILRPDATIFLPPEGGWLATPSTEAVASQMIANANTFTRTVTLNGKFPAGSIATLTKDRYDFHGNYELVTLSQMVLSDDAASLVFEEVPAEARGLAVTINTDLGQPTNHGQRYAFRDDWCGDFVRNIELRPRDASHDPKWYVQYPDARPGNGLLVAQRVG